MCLGVRAGPELGIREVTPPCIYSNEYICTQTTVLFCWCVCVLLLFGAGGILQDFCRDGAQGKKKEKMEVLSCCPTLQRRRGTEIALQLKGQGCWTGTSVLLQSLGHKVQQGGASDG